MNKKLLFWAIAFLGIANPAIAQTIVSNNDSTLSLACDLNLPGVVPSLNAQCAVEFADLVIPEITDSCGNIVVPTTNTSIFPITATGTTTIFWEYMNELGNIETQFQNINILDFTEPIPDVAILPNFYSQCAVLQTDLQVPTATDNCSPIVTVTNDAVFPITVSTLITWYYTDATGNTSFQPQDIYINDFTEPVADVAILPNIHGLCSVQQADVPVPTATDNCLGIVTVTNDAVFPITRSTLITWFYTDAHGNTSYQTQDIYIDDLTTPIPDNATLADVSALCEILEADVLVPTATDNCSGVIAATSNVVFPITTSTVITWTYTDANGNIETQTQNAFITDAVKPVPDVAVLPDFNSQCALLATDVPVPTATDNCSGVIAATSNAVFPITASTTITWTFTDANGNSDSQTQNILINDTTAPTPDAIALSDITVQCEVLEIDVIAPTATDNCSGIVTVTNDGIFPITASTTITWTYTDANGNSETQTQNIVINDTTAPTPDAIVLADITSQCEVLEADVIAPTATDNCSGIVTVTNDGIFPITASTTITWTYTDANGNSDSQTQNIVINDTTAPTPDAIALADITAQCEVLEADVIAPTATDNCSGVVTVTNDGIFPITASTTITWTFTDANGNSDSQAQNIVINDTTAPTPDAIALSDITVQCEVLEIDVIAPTATDNCSGIVTVTNDGIFPITASTTITWTFTDANGNSDSQTQNILINDTTAPTPDAIALSDITVQCEVLEIDVIAPTATDNCSGIVTVTNDGIFPITASTTITWTFTDANGNSDSQTQNILINDTTAPTPDAIALSDITVQCEVLEIDVIAPTATDNCSGIVTVTNDGIFPITASTTITWTYTDANGNSETQTQNIVINDTTAPTPDAIVLADITSQCEVLEADVIAPTATDNCSGILTVTNDGIFPITASTTITWTFTDANGNSDSQTQNILINDTTAPTPDAIALADITAQCEVLEADVIAPTASDNCSGVVTVTNDGIFPITASTTITWTFTDANGNSDSQTQNILINDTTAPTPDAIALADITAQCEVLEIDVIAPTATDNCSGIVTVTNDGIFPITASTTITWTFTDANGNSDSQTQNILINDTTAPTPDAIALADITAQCEVLEADVIAPTASDNCSGVVTVTNDGIFPITASTTITWTFTDANGNSDSQTQNILINDTTAPTPDAIALSDITVQCEVLEIDVIAPTATDNCSGIVTVTNDGIFPITASTTITWTFTDANGNSDSQAQNIVINDTTAPTPDAIALADITAQCEVLEADVIAPTATDNCSGVVTVTNDAVFPITTQGATTITWTYTDANGNTSNQTQDILIGDNTSPTVTLTDITVSVNVAGIVTINAAQLENGTANDNCGIASITVTPNTFTCTALGDHVVTVTVTDIHGNSVTDIATVTVTDPTDFCGALGVVQNEKAIFALYPNPTADIIYIESGNQTVVRAMSLYSLSGQLILEESYRQPSEKYSISLGALAQGTYLLKLETNDGTYTKRVIKQ